MSKIDPRLLEILVCPVSRTRLIYDKESQELISDVTKLAYPIKNGIPIMIPEEARKLSDEELELKRLYTYEHIQLNQ